jgi:hypothetical protein
MKLLALFALALPAAAQSAAAQSAAALLAQVDGIRWEEPFRPARSCTNHVPTQMETTAVSVWTHQCAETGPVAIRESFYYAFGEPAREVKLRVDIHPKDESPRTSAALLAALRARMIARYGPPDHAPEMMEIGFRHLRYGEPVNGDHWRNGMLHYFLHANTANLTPMGMRRGVQLVVLHDRLLEERAADEQIRRVDGVGSAGPPDDRITERVKAVIGAPYTRAVTTAWNTNSQRLAAVARLDRDITEILRGSDGAPAEVKAMRVLAADMLAAQLSNALIEPSPKGEREASDAAAIRRKLGRYGAKVGPMTHYGGLAYNHDLLWRVWREFPQTEAGEIAFVLIQQRGWSTSTGEGCPANPDLFREVIRQGEAYLTSHESSRFREEIVFTLAVAYESWWSIGRAPVADPIVSAPPYPRRKDNGQSAPGARERAIEYYREIVRLAPTSAEAASARRRLPRLILQLDTGQRRFFCSYC